MRDDSGLGEPAADARSKTRPRAVALHELYLWIAPWLSGVLLVIAALLGLFTASQASLSAGLVTTGLVLLALALGLKRYFDGASPSLWPGTFVNDAGALLVLIVLLAVVAILGLILAARAQAPVWEYAGYGFCGASLAVIAANLKHYFDWQDRKGDRAKADG